MQNGLVSIIVPCHNGAHQLTQSLQSLQAQTYSHWQAWVVGDVANVAQQFSAADPRIQCLPNTMQGGIAASYNAGLGAAQGQYVAFCPNGAVWLPQKLAVQLAFMQQSQAAFCYTHFMRQGVVHKPPASLNYAQFLNGGNQVCLASAILNRQMCRNLQFSSNDCPDYALWLDLTAQGFVGQCCPQILVQCNLNTNALKAAWQFFKVQALRQKLPWPQAAKNFINYITQALKDKLKNAP